MLRMYVFSLESETGGLFVEIEVNSLMLMIFIFIFAKTVSDSSRKVAQNKALVFHLSQPIKQTNVLYGKLMAQLMINMGLFTAIMALFVANILLFGFPISGDFWFVANSIVLTVLATTVGLMFSLFNVFPFKKRFKLLLVITPFLSFLYYVLYYTTLTGSILFIVLFFLMLFSFIAIIPSNRVFLEAWNRGTNPNKTIGRSFISFFRIGEGKIARSVLSGGERALLKREIAERMRSKEFIGTVITVLAITYGSLYIALDYSDEFFIESRFGEFFVPMMVGMGIFAASLLEPGLSQLSSIGKEGKNLWILKSSPLSGATIIKVKALANMVSLPLIILGPAVFVTLYMGYDVVIALFAALGALMMIMLFTGIGSWFGAKYPNFDESVKGYPDIMTTYLYAMVCFILCIMFSLIPLGIIFFDRFLGILAIIFYADLAALILYLGITLGGSAIDKLEVY
jgi:hypothetical protein